MSTVFIGYKAVALPQRFASAHVLNEHEAAMLNAIWLKRLSAKLRWLLSRRVIDATSLPGKALELAAEDLVPQTLLDDVDDDDDPVLEEAFGMATALITARLAQENLPLPKNLASHAKELLRGRPDIIEKARLRVEARYQAATELLGV